MLEVVEDASTCGHELPERVDVAICDNLGRTLERSSIDGEKAVDVRNDRPELIEREAFQGVILVRGLWVGQGGHLRSPA